MRVYEFNASVKRGSGWIPGKIRLSVANDDPGDANSIFIWEPNDPGLVQSMRIESVLNQFSKDIKKKTRGNPNLVRLAKDGEPTVLNFGVEESHATTVYDLIKKALVAGNGQSQNPRPPSPIPIGIAPPMSSSSKRKLGKAEKAIHSATSSHHRAHSMRHGHPLPLPSLGGNKPVQIDEDIKKALLAGDAELKDAYHSLVEAGMMTESDFWQSRAEEIEEERTKRSQMRGLSTGLTSDVRAATSTQERVQFVLNREKIARIFLESPAVEKLYRENVPHKIKEEEFWTMYFHSKYFYRDRSKDPNASSHGGSSSSLTSSKIQADAEALFGHADDDDDNGVNEIKVKDTGTLKSGNRPKMQVNPSIDLIANLNDAPLGPSYALSSIGMQERAGFGIADRDPSEADWDQMIRDKLKRKQQRGKKVSKTEIEQLLAQPPKSGPILSRYNQHARVVLDSGAEESEDVRKERIRRSRLMEKEAIVLHDLEQEPETPFMPLKIKNQEMYTKIGDSSSGSKHAGGEQQTMIISAIPVEPSFQTRGIRRWKPQLENVLPKSISGDIDLWAVLLSDSSIRHANGQLKSIQDLLKDGQNQLQDADREELLQLFHSSNEFRRHFWACYPAKSKKKLVAKQNALVEHLERIKDDLASLKQRLLSGPDAARNAKNVVPLIHPLEEQINCALDAAQRDRERREAKKKKLK